MTSTSSAHKIRVLSWNVLNKSPTSFDGLLPKFIVTVFEKVKPDFFLLQEVNERFTVETMQQYLDVQKYPFVKVGALCVIYDASRWLMKTANIVWENPDDKFDEIEENVVTLRTDSKCSFSLFNFHLQSKTVDARKVFQTFVNQIKRTHAVTAGDFNFSMRDLQKNFGAHFVGPCDTVSTKSNVFETPSRLDDVVAYGNFEFVGGSTLNRNMRDNSCPISYTNVFPFEHKYKYNKKDMTITIVAFAELSDHLPIYADLNWK